MELQKFYAGISFDAHRHLGAHPTQEGGFRFCTFAPAARQVSLIGEFSGWQELPMHKVWDGNFWQTEAPAQPGQMYKYRIYGADGAFCDHCDPYGIWMEKRPGTASVLWDRRGFDWQDQDWMERRTDCRQGPLNIYELHAGSWKRKSEEPEGWYNYQELAELLVPYLKQNGYNYLELLPLGEHPCDESWGYQQTGFFSPTSRYGTPDQLKAFVARCHQAGIGVLLDFVPVHFAVDGYALQKYDGTALYEYPHPAVGYSEWGSCNFIHSRGEVRSFLQSCACYWLEEYHLDGLRMDAISNMIYWQGDPARGQNMDAIRFLQTMNTGLKQRFPTAILAAEDSTSLPGVTKAVAQGGLGFDYKWNMGWMHDTLELFQTAPEYRPRDYHKLTFSMQYFYGEQYLLPLSHDEVVHGKATIAQKMQGDYAQKFPQARLLYLYQYAHPGKKLNFMGSELAQLREWDEKRGQDWSLLQYPIHAGFHRFLAELCQLYLAQPALWEQDYQPGGFAWVTCDQPQKCLYLFRRQGGGSSVLVALNLSDQEQSLRFSLPDGACLEPLISSEAERFGGTETQEPPVIELTEGAGALTLPAYAGRYYRIR